MLKWKHVLFQCARMSVRCSPHSGWPATSQLGDQSSSVCCRVFIACYVFLLLIPVYYYCCYYSFYFACGNRTLAKREWWCTQRVLTGDQRLSVLWDHASNYLWFVGGKNYSLKNVYNEKRVGYLTRICFLQNNYNVKCCFKAVVIVRSEVFFFPRKLEVSIVTTNGPVFSFRYTKDIYFPIFY